MELLIIPNGIYRDLQVRYSEDDASKILKFWYRFHVDDPKSAEEAEDFALGVKE